MSWGRDQDEVFFANICFPSQQACQQAPAAMAEQERQLRSGFHRAGPCIDYPATRQLLPAVAESERAFFCFRLRGETTSCAISAEVCRDQARHELADLDAPDHCAKRSSAVCFWSRDTDDNVSAACALTIDDCHALRRKLAHPDGRQGACQKIGTSI